MIVYVEPTVEAMLVVVCSMGCLRLDFRVNWMFAAIQSCETVVSYSCNGGWFVELDALWMYTHHI